MRDLRFSISDLRVIEQARQDQPSTVAFFMTREEMKTRTKAYANRVVKVCEALPNDWIARTLGKQLLRSGTSVGANYRAVCRAKSSADFVNKLRVVEEECDESLFWMDLLAENNLVRATRLGGLMREGDEILAIVVSSAKTARTSRNA